MNRCELDGPSRTIIVEPLRQQPAPPEPTHEPERKPEPAREPEKVPA